MADSSDEMGTTTTIIAPGAVARLGEALKTIEATALVLVTGAGSYTRSGARAAIEPQLDGYAVELVNGFSPNPTVEEVAAGLDAVERASVHGPPVIIGVGGGSAAGCDPKLLIFLHLLQNGVKNCCFFSAFEL